MKIYNWLSVVVLVGVFIATVLLLSGGCNKSSRLAEPKEGVAWKVVTKNGYVGTVYSFTTEDGTFYLAHTPDGVSLIKVK